MKLKIFQQQQPTSQEVESRIAAARAERAQLEARMIEIDEAAAAAYGTEDDSAAALETERTAAAARLRVIERAMLALNAEHRAALLRETAAAYRSQRQAIAADVKALESAKAKADKARAAYHEAAQAEQALRNRLNNAQGIAANFYDDQVKPAGISIQEWAAVRTPIDAETAAADNQIGFTRAQAEAVMSALPGSAGK